MALYDTLKLKSVYSALVSQTIDFTSAFGENKIEYLWLLGVLYERLPKKS